jgi:hypothetical protein
MNSRFGRLRWRPSLATLIGGALVILGFVLMNWHEGFTALIGVGTFGPGILRELGCLNDQDEFKRRAAHRAGYHAFIVTGLAAFLIYAYTRSGGVLQEPEELSLVYLALLWFTWMFSSLFAYWGPHKTAFRTLLVFGCAWGAFNVVGNLRHLVSMAMQLLVTTAPFFVLAYASRRWPRVAGGLLMALSVFFLSVYFGWSRFSHLVFLAKIATAVLFVGPLMASGAALLQPPSDEEGTISEAARALGGK